MKERQPTETQLRTWQDEIHKSGTRRITARILLKAFGIRRRTDPSTNRVIDWLRNQVPTIYVSGLDRVRLLDEPTFLSHIELTQIGRLVDKESVLMERFVAEIMPHLRLRNPQPKYRPTGSRDELDYLCEDTQGRSVVVEMKKEDGERHVVEQVLRYVQLIRQSPACKDPRGLILTGYADLHTRHALEELAPQYHIDWFIYGIGEQGVIRVKQIHVRHAGAKT